MKKKKHPQSKEIINAKILVITVCIVTPIVLLLFSVILLINLPTEYEIILGYPFATMVLIIFFGTIMTHLYKDFEVSKAIRILYNDHIKRKSQQGHYTAEPSRADRAIENIAEFLAEDEQKKISEISATEVLETWKKNQ